MRLPPASRGGCPASAWITTSAGRVVQHADADVIVGQAGFELLGDLGEHLVGIEGGRIGVSRNRIEERKVAALLVRSSLKRRAFFNGDNSLRWQVTRSKFQVAFVEHTARGRE